MTPKQRSRARVVQALYQWLTSGGEIVQIEQQFLNQKEGKISKAFFSNLILNIPKNYKPTIMNTGCCGMAGSFGYEKEHYKVSMQVGEDTLFPKIRNTSKEIEIVAAGTSCRHQIYDGTKRIAKHPITVLREALV